MKTHRQLLRGRQSFVFNATNLQALTRQRWIKLMADYQARIQWVFIDPLLTTVMKQNKARTEKVPEKVILRLAGNMEPPTWSEGHDLIYV